MPTSPGSSAAESLRTLYAPGALDGLTDGQLLDRFRSRSVAAEAAIAALIDRHGR